MPPRFAERPALLVSSSGDLKDSREKMRLDLKSHLQAWGHDIEVMLWEELEKDDNFIDARSPIQRQIDALLQGRLMYTIVMFGEKIGFPLLGKPPDDAKKILDEWKADGLVHPWPEDIAKKNELLDAGKFPLTGTTYELFVALSQSEEVLDTCVVGYVADRSIGKQSELTDDIQFNDDQWRRSLLSDATLADERERRRIIDEIVLPQRKALFNLLRALAKRGTPTQRFSNQDAMVAKLVDDAVRRMKRELPDQSGQLPFKSGLGVYDRGDPMDLPDRVELRKELKGAIELASREGEMLALEGPSGCGKSSLLRKGFLDELPFHLSAAQQVLFRPEELCLKRDDQPFACLCSRIGNHLISAGLGDFTRLGTAPGSPKEVAALAAKEIGEALAAANAHLVIAIDQFEDIIDHAELEIADSDKPRSWWQVLRFLGSAAKQANIHVVGTLEKLRRDFALSETLRKKTGLRVRTIDVDFPAGQVVKFVEINATRARLPLSRDLLVKIQSMVEEFEKGRIASLKLPASSMSKPLAQPSFLPLLGLWLARLFERFQDRAGSTESLTDSHALTGRSNDIQPSDLADRGIELRMDGLVAELVNAAWSEAGAMKFKQTGHSPRVTDPETLSSFVSEAVGSTQLPENYRMSIAMAVRAAGGPNLKRLWELLSPIVPDDVPGMTLVPVGQYVPNEGSLNNFLAPLVALDEAGNIRLQAGPAETPFTTNKRLIDAHRKRRLLVSSGPGRLQLVHQAVIQNWSPGRSWFDQKKSDLRIRRKLGARYQEACDEAEEKYGTVAPERVFELARRMASNDDRMVQDAARLLNHQHATWPDSFNSSLEPFEEGLRDFCLSIISTAENGSLSYETSEGETKLLAHLAAKYDLAHTLENWIEQDPDLLTTGLEANGDLLLHQAAWGSSSVVRLLLGKGTEISTPNSEDWHPIAAGFQNKDLQIFDLLIGAYSNPSDIIGPADITLLHEAARAENPQFIEALVRRADDLNPQAETGATPLMFAADGGRISQIIALMQSGAKPTLIDENGSTVLHHAVFNDRSEAIVTILRSGELGHNDREKILTHQGLDSARNETPLALAAKRAQPSALAALLDFCDPSDPCHRVGGAHPITLLTSSNVKAQGGEPLADRVSMCARFLLEKGGMTNADLLDARRSASDFIDVRRQIDEYLARKGDLADIGEEELRGFLLGRRPALALSVLRNAPHLLDQKDDDGFRVSDLLVERGHPQVLSVALAEGLAPKQGTALFRFAAGLKLLRSGTGLPPEAETVHPFLAKMQTGEEVPGAKEIADLSLKADRVRTILHRFAIRGPKEAYQQILEGMDQGPPLDDYGRPPSADAPLKMQSEFKAIEDAVGSKGDHQ